MKNRTLIFFLLALSSIQLLNAQTEKGSNAIGGSIRYTNNSSDYSWGSSENSFAVFNPGYSHFLRDNFSLGLDFRIENSRSSNISENTYNEETYERINDYKTISYGVGLTAQNYIKLTDNFGALISSRLGFGMGTTHQEFTTNDPNYVESDQFPSNQEILSSNLSFSVNPGLIYFATPRFGLHGTFGGLNFISSTSVNESLEVDNERSWTNLSFNLNDFSQLRFGASYFF